MLMRCWDINTKLIIGIAGWPDKYLQLSSSGLKKSNCNRSAPAEW
jgi:hypothetical protein